MIANMANIICADLFGREAVFSAGLVCFFVLEIFPVIFYSLIGYVCKRLETLPFQVRQL
jgi:hypothetical protein